jgi:hypothetical protein
MNDSLYESTIILVVLVSSEHETEDELVRGEIRCIATIEIQVIFSNPAFNIKLSIEVITQAHSESIIDFG